MKRLFETLRLNGRGLQIALSLAGTLSASAQIIDQWTHASPIAESSAVVAMDENYMFVVDNEDEFLRLYARYPETQCAAPAYLFDARPNLGLSSNKPEDDLEAAVKVEDENGTRIYWMGSHGNSKSGGSRPNRNRLFATQVSGDGTGSLAYSLSYVGRYDQLRTDLLDWDANNGHGMGANYFGLTASAGVPSEQADAFNIEGLVMAPDGVTAYLAFRAPLVNPSGPTDSTSPRTHALLIPLLNMPALVTGNPTSGPGLARFGPPIILDLGGRGVRSIDCASPGQYLITSGPTGEASFPPAAPYNFRLFVWTGDSADQPRESPTEIPAGFSPEGAMLPPGLITQDTVVQFVSDDSGGCWRSFTALAGIGLTRPPHLKQRLLANGVQQLVIDGEPGTYTVQISTNLKDWNDIATLSFPSIPFTYADSETANLPVRFYRVLYEK